MSIIISIVTAILTFFLSALALKLSLHLMGQPSQENKYGTAVTVAGLLSVCGLLLTPFPFFVSWLVYPLLWLLIVRSVYRISFTKSIAVAVLQGVVRMGLVFLLGFII